MDYWDKRIELKIPCQGKVEMLVRVKEMSDYEIIETLPIYFI